MIDCFNSYKMVVSINYTGSFYFYRFQASENDLTQMRESTLTCITLGSLNSFPVCLSHQGDVWWLSGNCPSSAPSIHTAFNLIKGRKELAVNWLALDSFCLRHPLSFKHKCQCFKFIFLFSLLKIVSIDLSEIFQRLLKCFENAAQSSLPLRDWTALQ